MWNMRIAAKFQPVRAPVDATGMPLAANALGLLWGCLELQMRAPGAATSAPTQLQAPPSIAGDSDAYTMRMLCGTYAEYA